MKAAQRIEGGKPARVRLANAAKQLGREVSAEAAT